MNTNRIGRWLMGLMVGVWFAGQEAGAVVLQWDAANTADAGAASGGTGTWDSVTANWWNTNAPAQNQAWTNGADDTATFSVPGGLVTVVDTITVSRITFNKIYTVTGGVINLTGAATIQELNDDNPVVYSRIDGTAGLVVVARSQNGRLSLLNTNNTYTGGTLVTNSNPAYNGTLAIWGDGCLGAVPPDASGTNITLAGKATLVNASFTQAATLHSNRTIAVTGTSGGFSTQSGTQPLTLNGRILSSTAAAISFCGYQNGEIVLVNNPGNAYTATNVIARGGTLRIGVDNALPTTSPVLWTLGSYAGPSLDLNGRNQALSGIFCGVTNARWGVIANTATGTTAVLTISGTSDFGGNIQNGGTASRGVVALTKSGSGTLTLSGTNNTYTGDTLVTGGTLALGVGGTIASSTVFSVSAGATFDVTNLTEFVLSSNRTLRGDGCVLGDINAAATNSLVSPGLGGVGTLTVTGNVTLAGALLADLNLAAVTGDRLAVSGDLTLGGSSVLTFVPAGTFGGGSYTIATYGGTLSGTFGVTNAMPSHSRLDYGNGVIRLVGLSGSMVMIQ